MKPVFVFINWMHEQLLKNSVPLALVNTVVEQKFIFESNNPNPYSFEVRDKTLYVIVKINHSLKQFNYPLAFADALEDWIGEDLVSDKKYRTIAGILNAMNKKELWWEMLN
jgi:hypothetical protein